MIKVMQQSCPEAITSPESTCKISAPAARGWRTEVNFLQNELAKRLGDNYSFLYFIREPPVNVGKCLLVLLMMKRA